MRQVDALVVRAFDCRRELGTVEPITMPFATDSDPNEPLDEYPETQFAGPVQCTTQRRAEPFPAELSLPE